MFLNIIKKGIYMIENNILKVFMISENPNYLKLTLREQDEYRIKNIAKLENLYKEYIFKKVTDSTFLKNVGEITQLNNLPNEVRNEIYTLLALFYGIGKNSFNIKYTRTFKDILSFKTLYDYDLEIHRLEEKSEIQDSNNTKLVESPYRMRLYEQDANCILKNREQMVFTDDNEVLSIATIKGHEAYKWTSNLFGDKKNDKLVNHKFENICLNSIAAHVHESVDMNIYLYICCNLFNANHDLKTKLVSVEDDKGLEYEEIINISQILSRELYENLHVLFDDNKKINKTIWIDDRDYFVKKYVFGNKNILKNIRLSHWQEDTEKYAKGTNKLNMFAENYIQKYTSELKKKINAEYNRVINKSKQNKKIVKINKKEIKWISITDRWSYWK
jgi:hypothetical protein